MFKCITECKSQCCGIVPIPNNVFSAFRRKIKKTIIKEFNLNGHITCITEDNSCVFLDSDNRCMIYVYRPLVCRMYGQMDELPCPFVDNKGNIRTDDDKQKTFEIIENQNKERLGKICL